MRFRYDAQMLEEIGKAYDENADAMVEASKAGRKMEHRRRIREERRLHRLDIRCRKALGILLQVPKVTLDLVCAECGGRRKLDVRHPKKWTWTKRTAWVGWCCKRSKGK